MPVREPKGRLLVREYMADREFMTVFAADVREAYLLLALFADDGGWLDWDPGELAGAMYRYWPIADREVFILDVAVALEATGRLKRYKCGHAFMPKVADRPRSGSPEYRVRDAHQSQCKSSRSRVKSSPSRVESSRPPNLTVPNQTSPVADHTVVLSEPTRGRARGGAPARVGETLSEFQRRVPRPGRTQH